MVNFSHKISFYRNPSTVYHLPELIKNNQSSPDDGSLSLSEATSVANAYLNSPEGKRLSSIQRKKILLSLQILKNKKRVIPCYAGDVDLVIYPEGDISLCENTLPIGNIRDFDYDLQKACRGDNFKSTYRQTKDCACLNGCNLLTSLNHHLNFSAELPSQ